MKKILLLILLFNIGFVHVSHSQVALDSLPVAVLDSLAFECYKSGNYRAGVPYMKKSMELAEVANDDAAYFSKSHRLGILYSILGEFEAAEKIYKKKLAYCEKKIGKKTASYYSSLEGLGNLYSSMGKYEAAEPLLLEALEICLELEGEQHENYARSLDNLAVFYERKNDYENAELYYIKVLKLNEALYGKEHRQYASTLNNFAVLYKNMARYKDAESLYLEVIAIREKKLGIKHPDYAAALSNMGVLYKNMARYKEAEVLYQQVIVIDENTYGKNSLEYALNLTNLGILYKNTQRYEDAAKLLITARDINVNKIGKESMDYANSLINIADAYKGLERYKEAEDLILESLVIIEGLYGKQFKAYIEHLLELGELYEMVDNELAKKVYLEALFLNNSKQNSLMDISEENIEKLLNAEYRYPGYALRALEGLRLSLTKSYQNNKDAALLKKGFRLLEGCMAINEEIRKSFNTQEDKQRILSENTLFVKTGIESALQLETLSGDKTYLEAAFGFAEQNKSILLADALKTQRAHSMGDLPDSLSIKEQELQEQLAELQKNLNTPATAQKNKKEFRSELNALNQEIDLFKKYLEENFPKYYQIKYASIMVTAKEAQAQLDEKTALLQYFATDSIIYLFYLDQKEMKIYPLEINQTTLKRATQALRRSLSDYAFIGSEKEENYALFTEKAHWFYKKLLAIALEQTEGIENLVIIPDSELGHLPFEVFLTEAAPNEGAYSSLAYLLRRYKISYNYSASLWNENLKVKHHGLNGKLLAVAANYKGDSTIFSRSSSPYLEKLRKSLSDLPSASKEVKVLMEQFEGDFKFGEAANEAFFKENASDYGVLHLAMHGVLNKRVPILSSMVFTENQDSVEDNFLQAYEIAHLKLNADLVVLSACETGYGKFEQGEGVLSLARSFMYAGVPSLVVSLWQVNDESTAILMQSFYQELAAGQHKDEALRQAKLAYLKNATGLAAHPAFWSPFIQIGDNRPIGIESKGGFLWIYGLGGLLIVLLLSFFIGKKRQVA